MSNNIAVKNTETEHTLANFYKSFAYLALPMIGQQFINTLLNFADSIMVGQLGEVSIAAVGFANKLFFIFILTAFGACGGIGVFMAQYYGKKDYYTLQKLFAIMVMSSLIVGAAFLIIAYFFATNFIALFSIDTKVIGQGSSYLKIISFSYPLTAFSLAITMSLRSMGLTKQALYITIIATGINIVLNYLLIYGHGGFPKMGVNGAAWATLFARGVETLCFIYLFFRYGYGLRTKIKNYFGLKKDIIISIIKVSTPIVFTEFLWVLGTTLLGLAYAKLGTTAAVSVQISDILVSLSSIIFMGLANAASIFIGQTLGKNDIPLAIAMSKKIIKMAFWGALFCALLSFTVIDLILSLYKLSAEAREMTRRVLIVMAIAIFFKLMNWCFIIGILRAGGDTKIAFLLDVVLLGFFAIPIAFLGSMVFKLDIHYIVALANIEEVLKLILVIWRYRTKKWIHNLTGATPAH
ncbi:MATE family efflux transporter [Candidatus Hepatincolaceae symbiont of Richtersius coronifer]